MFLNTVPSPVRKDEATKSVCEQSGYSKLTRLAMYRRYIGSQRNVSRVVGNALKFIRFLGVAALSGATSIEVTGAIRGRRTSCRLRYSQGNGFLGSGRAKCN